MKHFKSAQRLVGKLDPEVTCRIVEASADIAVIVDTKGVVKDVAHNDKIGDEVAKAWIGSRWVDTVTVESRPKITDLLNPEATGEPSRWRQVNHLVASGDDLPVRYKSFPIADGSRILAVGHELASVAKSQQRLIEAQVAVEREYSRVRGAETRYRALFQLSKEAILIVDGTSLRLTEVNPAATKLLSNGSSVFTGRRLNDLFDQDSAETVASLLASVRTSPRVDDVQVKLAHSLRPMWISASLFRQDAASHLIVRLIPASTTSTERSPGKPGPDVVSLLPDAFVVTDENRRIRFANTAFLDLVQLASVEQVLEQPIERWLGRTTVDLEVLVANLREHGTVSEFTMLARGEYGANEDVVVSAVAALHGRLPSYGLSIRKLKRHADQEVSADPSLQRSVERLTKLVGRVPLKEIVRDTSDLIEQMCIQAALELTSDNRASAAEILGLSRQSLYVKLRRHGLASGDPENNG
ncbi:MAG: transcriptional regulator PpsR [Hyphomicrobiaceae bacterium]